VVDDGSTNDIKSEISDLRVHFIRHFTNLGQGASLQTGMDYALQNGAKFVAHFDADGQHRKEDLEKMLSLIKENHIDIILGSRFLTLENTAQIPKSRRFILQLARVVNVCFSGLWLTDAHNGLRVLNRKALTKIRLKENRMAHATEILQQIKNKKLNWCEVSVKIKYTDYSQEKGQSNWNALNILFDLIIRKFI
jgi:glycosyltransferase involved in cell wall biosynthesis